MKFQSFFLSRSSCGIIEHRNKQSEIIQWTFDRGITNIPSQPILLIIKQPNMSLLSFLVVCLATLQATEANVWDNIFSETLASSPIILSESLNFKFPINYQGIILQGNFDFNHALKLITAIAQKPVFMGFDIQVFRLQIQLENLLLTIQTLINGCEKYRLVLSEEDTGKVTQISIQSKAFLINLLFEYIGRNKFDGKFNEYVLMPDLVTKHEIEHELYQKNALVVVSNQGEIVKIYEDKDKKTEIPFSLRSKVNKKMQCEGPIQELTKEDLYKKLRASIENKDYQKIPGYDKDKAPKIPIIDPAKLPKWN